MLLIPMLQNDVLRKINESSEEEWWTSTYSFNILYELTGEDSLLRKYFVHLCVREQQIRAICETPETLMDLYPKRMLVDILLFPDKNKKLDLHDYEV